MTILLDIDGVLIHGKPWIPLPLLEDGFYDFNNLSVDILNDILTETNSQIILTTSHKYSFSLNKWIQIFKNRGIHDVKINRLEPNKNNLSRCDEIIKWYNSNSEIKNFVIIDDDTSLNNLPTVLKSRLVQPKSMIGLNKNHVGQILDILSN